MPDPWAVIAKIRRLVEDDGLILIAVPDFEGLQSKAFGSSWLHLDLPRHLYHFTATSIDGMLHRTEFIPVAHRHQEFEYDLIGWWQSALNTVLPTPNVLFDFLTTFTGIYARALMPSLKDPVSSYPALAIAFLPPVVQGIFYLGLLATVMSTVDGYTFIGGVNFGRDLYWRWRGNRDESRVNFYSQVGFLVTAVLAVLMALLFRSAVDLWHDVGSVGVPALLVPIAASYHPRWHMRPAAAAWCIAVSGAVALGWLLSKFLPGMHGGYLLGVEPIYAGLVVSVGFWLMDRVLRRRPAMV